jgi:hypothetical protein
MGVLLIRLVAGIIAIVQGLSQLRSGLDSAAALFDLSFMALGSLVIVGLWTPVVGTLLALIALWHAFPYAEHRWYCVVVGLLGAALALLGPGMWSVDAHLFGWRRLEISGRKRPDPPR